MVSLASPSPWHGRLRALALFGFLSLGCDEQTGTGGPEDKDGVKPVGPPSGSTAAGTGGLGGEGAGTTGKPCFSATTCDDDDPCTADDCVDDKCENVNLADDEDACTFDRCVADSVTGEVTVTNPAFFILAAEDFEGEELGWELGPQWFIDNPDLATTNGDPPADNTPLGTNVAGVARTSFVTNQPLMSYLTSPTLFVQEDQLEDGSITLVFWRRLETLVDDLNGVVVEAVTEGDNVVPLWEPTAAVDDRGSGWFEMRLDLTSVVAISPSFQVRFGFRSSGTGDQSGWNIDDIEIRKTVVAVDGEICTLDLCADQDGAAVASNPEVPPFTVGMIDYECVPGLGPQPAMPMPMP
jgi:hypothetical protein